MNEQDMSAEDQAKEILTEAVRKAIEAEVMKEGASEAVMNILQKVLILLPDIIGLIDKVGGLFGKKNETEAE